MVANVADRVAVMYAGQIVEYGNVDEIFYNAWHPYTWALLSSLPQLGIKGQELYSIQGAPPNLFTEPKSTTISRTESRTSLPLSAMALYPLSLQFPDMLRRLHLGGPGVQQPGAGLMGGAHPPGAAGGRPEKQGAGMSQ